MNDSAWRRDQRRVGIGAQLTSIRSFELEKRPLVAAARTVSKDPPWKHRAVRGSVLRAQAPGERQ